MLKFKYYLVFIYIILSFTLFNIFAYEIYQFNDKVRVFLMNGKSNVRTFDSNGIPVSHSRKIDNFISPFYVIHYGIIYSNIIKEKKFNESEHWKDDPSLKYWNVQINDINKEKAKFFFKNTLDWLEKNISYTNGKAHFIYNFEWVYSGYPNGKLSNPWWSGLTDSYAIILFLRAYDIFNDNKYLILANDLYNSVITDFNQYGSLTKLNKSPWIEEYVDPININTNNKMSFVLNGMIYSTYSIYAYEKYKNINHFQKKLFESIENNLLNYIDNSWIKYDLIGNDTNMKYYLVTKSLIDRLKKDGFLNGEIKDHIKIMSSFDNLLAVNYILNGARSTSWLQFTIFFLIVVFLPLYYIIFRKLKNEI